MKDKIFHFFGNIIEQTALPTTLKLAIANRLDLFLFFLIHINHSCLKTPAEARISEDFMKYIYKNNIDENTEKVEILKKGLDLESRELIEQIMQRQKYICEHNILDFRLLTKKEKQNQQINIYAIKRKYRGFSNYYGIENFYFHSGLRFLHKSILKKYEGKDVIDAGAANGDTPAIFSREYSFGTIYAFEPENSNYEKLLNNIKRFHLANVIPVKKGVGDKRKRFKITSEEGQSRMSLEGKQDVDIITIDKFVEENALSIGLIKMDIEGFESYAIKGVEKTIKEQKPLLLISIYHNGKDFFEIKPLLERVGGYKFMVRKLNPYSFIFDTMLIGIPI